MDLDEFGWCLDFLTNSVPTQGLFVCSVRLDLDCIGVCIGFPEFYSHKRIFNEIFYGRNGVESDEMGG